MVHGDVAIVGAGMIEFGELFDQSYQQMAATAYRNCVESVDKGLSPDDIDAGWLGTAEGYLALGRETVTGAELAEITGLNIPATRIENACATGSDAFRNAALAIASGVYDVALVLGVDKMRDTKTEEFLRNVTSRRGYWGMTAPSYFALYAKRHMAEYGTTREQLSQVAVKNHAHGALCDFSYYRYRITTEDVVESPMVTDPFNLLDCCPQTDGAAAVILTSADIARQYTDDPVYLVGTGLGTENYSIEYRPNYVESRATVRAAREAYDMAGLDPGEVDLVELHDCFTFAEILNYEDLGFAEKGEGGQLIEDGVTALDGALPTNPSGGLKAKGHPIGATGVAQIAELFWQLRHEAGDRQVPDPTIGLQHNLGGPLAVSCVNILRR
jgi:acetyl-CoA C-acetyltransferase